MWITALSGAILLAALLMYFTVLIGTIAGRRRLSESETPPIPFAEARPQRREGVVAMLDDFRLWFVLAVFLVLVAYGPSLVYMFANQQPVPGMRLW
jgi:cytochrome c oxidase subunit I